MVFFNRSMLIHSLLYAHIAIIVYIIIMYLYLYAVGIIGIIITSQNYLDS